ncbi:MAG: hypothetical protein AB9834_07430 [Lentimicrobium sp.]
MKYLNLLATILLLAGFSQLSAQPVCTPWGNVKSIFTDGEEMRFETSLRSVNPDWKSYVKTEKYNWEGQQTYVVEGNTHTVSHLLLGLPLGFTSRMSETGKGKAQVEMTIKANEVISQAGTYFCMEVPGTEFSEGTITFFNNKKQISELDLKPASKKANGDFVRLKANKVVWKSANRLYTITSDETVEVFLRQDFDGNPAYKNDPWPQQKFVESDPVMEKADYQLYFTMIKGNAEKGVSKQMIFDIEASGTIDREPVTLTLDAKNPGRKWDGISGNYRNQFPDKDPMVIDYCLDSLRVTWGRISMWWENWQPEEGVNPTEQAKAGKLPKRVYEQMELARKLQQRDIPVIVSVWAAPDWAVDKNNIPKKGVHLDQKKMDQICESIARYLIYLKLEYGVEASMFSFNEPDCGVEVFQTPGEHAIFNKAIGAYLKSKGLATKMLLGDTGHGTALAGQIVWPTINDPSIHPYIGAIALHTYHGCNTSDLNEWDRASKAMNVPLMVTEGGTNSAAHRSPLVFLQPWFQLGEIDTYIRICNLCQPLTMMEWQLTSDYSVLTGKGLYGDEGPLRPTQRFWNLKQLGATPAGSFWMPISCDGPNISCAVAGSIAEGIYSIHLVNNGATREVTITGIPELVKSFNIYVTDATRGMKKIRTIPVASGKAAFTLEAQTYTSLIND